MRRAVITGLGIVSSIGVNKEDVLASLKAGKSGITFSEQFAEMGLRSQVWGNIDIDLKDHIDRKAMRFMGDAAGYAYVATTSHCRLWFRRKRHFKRAHGYYCWLRWRVF